MNGSNVEIERTSEMMKKKNMISWLNDINFDCLKFHDLVNDFRFFTSKRCHPHFNIYGFCRVLNNYPQSSSISFSSLERQTRRA